MSEDEKLEKLGKGREEDRERKRDKKESWLSLVGKILLFQAAM